MNLTDAQNDRNEDRREDRQEDRNEEIDLSIEGLHENEAGSDEEIGLIS